MSERFRVIPSAYVFLLDGSSVLLQLRAGTGYMDGHWAAGAAGHVEAGESVIAAAVRETREELGVTVDGEDLLPWCVMHRTGSGAAIDERVDFFFAVRRWGGTPVVQEPAKVADLAWFDLGALPTPVPAYELTVLTRWRDGTLSPVLTEGFEDRGRRG